MHVCTYAKCGKETKTLVKGLCPTCYAVFRRRGTPERERPNRRLGVTECSYCETTVGPFIKSLCRTCYQRQYKNGTPEIQRVRNLCEVPGCDDPVKSRGLCPRHLKRMERHGSVDAGRPDGWGAKRKHPMYEAWNSMRRGSRLSGGCDPRWDDFWAFLDDMGERPEGQRLYRRDPAKPFSKENAEWRPTLLSPGELASNSERQRIYRIKRPDVHKRLHRRKLYGIVDDWYERTLEAQGGVCAICHQPETQRHRVTGEIIALAVDHSKETGLKRGILCKACNVSIGAMGHSTDRLRAAIAYLDAHAETEDT
jgi:hypothetical protein